MFGEIISTATVEKSITNYIDSIEDVKTNNVSWIRPPYYNVDEILEKKLPDQRKS